MLLPPLSTRLNMQRWISLVVLIVLVVIGGMLVHHAQHQTLLYSLGGWQPPFGILFVVDRLTALLIGLTAVLAFCAGLYSAEKEDREGSFYYPLFLFQVMGINGAFLTGDLFNLFVFFELLLIASYALLVCGGGREQTKAGFQYVTLNLIGSALFLVASSLVPFQLNWKEDLKSLPRLHRQMYWVYGGYIVLSIVAFGVISIMNAAELASGSGLARAFCAYVALFWGIRLVLQAVFDVKAHLTKWWLKCGYHGLTLLFLSFLLIYGWAAIHP